MPPPLSGEPRTQVSVGPPIFFPWLLQDSTGTTGSLYRGGCHSREVSRRFSLPHDVQAVLPFCWAIFCLCVFIPPLPNPFPTTYRRGHLFCLWRPPRYETPYWYNVPGIAGAGGANSYVTLVLRTVSASSSTSSPQTYLWLKRRRGGEVGPWPQTPAHVWEARPAVRRPVWIGGPSAGAAVASGSTGSG